MTLKMFKQLSKIYPEYNWHAYRKCVHF